MKNNKSLGEIYRKKLLRYFEEKIKETKKGINSVDEILKEDSKHKYKSRVIEKDRTEFLNKLSYLREESFKELKKLEKYKEMVMRL